MAKMMMMKSAMKASMKMKKSMAKKVVMKKMAMKKAVSFCNFCDAFTNRRLRERLVRKVDIHYITHSSHLISLLVLTPDEEERQELQGRKSLIFIFQLDEG